MSHTGSLAYSLPLPLLGSLLVLAYCPSGLAQLGPVRGDDDYVDHFSMEEQLRRVLVDGEDRFNWLTPEAHARLKTDDGTSISQKIAELHDFDAPTMVDVQLVGFEGDGNGEVELAAEKLERHLDMLRMAGVRSHVMHPDDESDATITGATVSGPTTAGGAPGRRGAGGAGAAGNDHNNERWANAVHHDLAVRHKVMFRVRRAPASVATAINKVIDDRVVGREESFLPISVVDDIVRADYVGSQRALSYAIYILNPKLGSVVRGGTHTTPVYWCVARPMRALQANVMTTLVGYPVSCFSSVSTAWFLIVRVSSCPALPRLTPTSSASSSPSSSPSSSSSPPPPPPLLLSSAIPALPRYLQDPSLDRCGVTMWVGNERYMWLDITAGPATLGPRTSGTGVVLEDSLPRLQVHPHHGAFGGSAAAAADDAGGKGAHNRPQEGFVAHLAAFVQRATLHLVTPTAAYFPVDYKRTVTVHLVVIHDGDDGEDDALDGGGDAADREDGEAPPKDAEERSRERWAAYTRAVEGMALPGQTVNVVHHRIRFDECELCVSSLANSLRSHTTMARGLGLGTMVHEYIDGKEMARWLRHFDDKFWGLQDAASPREGVTPVFVYELSRRRTPLLLDRFHQALSFRDIVVAVRTDVRQMLLDMECNGNHLTMSPRDPTRAAFAATIQTVWGVAPSHLRWDPLRHEIATDHAWAVGSTPFGPFGSGGPGGLGVSFSQHDAAARNAVFSDVNATITTLVETLKPFLHTGRLLSEVLPPEYYLSFVERWNFLKTELFRSAHFLSLHNFNQSLYHSQSVRRDAAALAEILTRVAATSLEHRIHCAGSTRHTGDAIAAGLAGLATLGTGGGPGAVHEGVYDADRTLLSVLAFLCLGLAAFCYGNWLRYGVVEAGASVLRGGGLQASRKLQYYKDPSI